MQVKTITALTVAALAEAAAPYGIESFDEVLEPLWKGIRLLRGKVLASFLKVRSSTSLVFGKKMTVQCIREYSENLDAAVKLGRQDQSW